MNPITTILVTFMLLQSTTCCEEPIGNGPDPSWQITNSSCQITTGQKTWSTNGLSLIPGISGDVCSIGRWNIRSCSATSAMKEEVLVVHVSDARVVLMGDYSMFSWFDHSVKSTWNCSGQDCANGPAEYKKWFKGDNDCECQVDPEQRRLSLKLGLTTLEVDSLQTLVLMITRQVDEVKIDDCTDCWIKCSSGGFVSQFPGRSVETYKICNGLSCVWTDSLLSVPTYLMMQSSKFSITAYSQTNNVWHYETSCPFEDACNLIRCKMCLDRFINVQCWSSMEILVMAGMLVMLSLSVVLGQLIFSLLKCTMWPFLILMKILIKLLRLIMKSCGWNCRKGYSRVLEFADGTQENVKEYKETIIDISKIKKKKENKSSSATNLLKMSVLLAALKEGQSCLTQSTLSTNSFDCARGINGTICSSTQSMLINLAPSGLSTCFSVMESEMATSLIEFRTSSLDLKCKETLLYWVNDYSMDLKQKTHCEWTDSCKLDKCRNYNQVDNDEFWSDHQMTRLGKSDCLITGGGLLGTHSCFSSRACTYYRLMLKPESDVPASVHQCTELEWHLELEIRHTDDKGVDSNTYKLHPGVPVKTSVGTITLGTSSLVAPPIANSCIIRMGSRTSLVECNGAGSYSQGKIGEVQCNSEQDAKDLTNKCKYGNHISVISQQDGVVYKQVSHINILKSMTINPMPITTQNYVIVDDDGMIIKYKNRQSFQMHFVPSNIRLRSISDKVSCQGHFESLKGCYQCVGGSTLSLFMKAEKQTLAHVICGDTSMSLKVTETLTKLSVVFHSMQPKVDMTCRVVCSANSFDLKVQGDLVYKPTEDVRSIESASLEDVNQWARILWNTLGWFKWIILFFMMVMGLLMMVCLKVRRKVITKSHNI